MERPTIAPIVEGHGEVYAVPALLHRIAHDLGVYDLNVVTPLRVSVSKIRAASTELTARVQAAAERVGDLGGVLVIVDADDHCPAELGPKLREVAQAARADKRIGVVLASREYESWLLAAAESLAGHHGLPEDLKPPPNHASLRDAKGWLSARMATGRYKPTVDQLPLTRALDLALARERSDSFDKLCREVEHLLT